MPVYHLILWSNDLGRVVECELGEPLAAARLEEFDEAGRCALRLSAGAARLAGVTHTGPAPALVTGWASGSG